MKYYVVDAFAERIFEGNPAGVMILEDWISEQLMQNIAIENNLSETAFAVREGERYGLRWFTPGGEIDLCGHATLAAAFVILNFIEGEKETVEFLTKSGILIVNKRGELYELDFPAMSSKEVPITDVMEKALGVRPEEAYLNRDLILVLKSEDAVKNLCPDFDQLKKLPDGLGVCVTAAGNEVDFVSRAYFPKLNINEDPVTGSLHCSLIPYWSNQLGKKELSARQLSTRGGRLFCSLQGERVKIAGKAALYSVGEIMIES
ncbi:PhzF family phenazine biosynthesis isomerase [Bacillus lacus]|uniref:PhzF family phenazine biosynthesis isomerase n=1 Tax=Metabacillus lacus TaxID=1983721 RepID=A0A7X2LZB4_9BACI|nr:PhzF family phenazine biosynthesis protein [Metabacillus lacus]MRX73236.1 PhzF family phenazine biosynthesis isomerase [Metabacillus lacus]